MSNKKFIFNDFYYSTKKVDFKKNETLREADISAMVNEKKLRDAYCEIKYDFSDDGMPMMVKISSRFYVKQFYTDYYSVFEGKSVFELYDEYPATFGKGDFHSNNGTVLNFRVTLAELAFQHISKHVGYIYCETQDKILIEIPVTYGIYLNLFKNGVTKNEWILLEEHIFDQVVLAHQMSDKECELEFESLKLDDYDFDTFIFSIS